MRWRVRHPFYAGLRDLNIFAENYSLLILGALIALATYQKWMLILHTDGGGDLLGADIPKSMMLISGQDPYSSNPWASPYPPFLLAVVGGIIRITTGTIALSPQTIGLISRNVRSVGLFADVFVAIIVFLALRSRGLSGLYSLVPSGIFLALPSISLSPYYWFNSDVFGYPILAGSILALIRRQYLLGSILLSLATIFKIHPILAIPLLLVWQVKRNSLRKTFPAIVGSTSILSIGLAAPVILPGYLGSVLGFNLSSGFGAGTASFTMMNLLYTSLPAFAKISIPMTIENQIWLAVLTLIFVTAIGFVWSRGQLLDPVDVVAIGLFVWLLPLRQMYTHYIVWAIVPFVMRGRLAQTIIMGSLLEFANTLASWSWDLPPDPFPVLATPTGFLATSLVYFSISAFGLLFSTRMASVSPMRESEQIRIPTLTVRSPIHAK